MIAGVQYIPGPRVAQKLAHNTGSLLQRQRVLEQFRRCPDRWWRTRDLAMECGMSSHTALQRCQELVKEGLADEQFSAGRCEFRHRVVYS